MIISRTHAALPIQWRMANGIFEFLLCVAIQPRHNGTQSDYCTSLCAQLRVCGAKENASCVPDLAISRRVYRAITTTLTATGRLLSYIARN